MAPAVSSVVHPPLLVLSIVRLPGDDSGSVLLVSSFYVEHLVRIIPVDNPVALERPLLSRVVPEGLHHGTPSVTSTFRREIVEHRAKASLLIQPPQLVRTTVLLLRPDDEVRSWTGVATSDVHHLPMQLTDDVELAPGTT